MSDLDTKCYNDNYSDVGGASNARNHYMTIGHQQGRQPNCGRSLTHMEEQTYLNRYPDLQKAYGTPANVKYYESSPAKDKAHEHFIDYGHKEGRYPGPWEVQRAKPVFCIDGDEGTEWNRKTCGCGGTTWYGRTYDENGDRITTWEKFRMWGAKPITDFSVYIRCNTQSFGELEENNKENYEQQTF